MKAVEITQPGPPDVLKLTERPDPVPAAGEILIDVAAAGVNRPDLLQRLGKYPPPPGASDIPGLEVAGVVAALGADVRGWSVGDPICALLAGGGYATRAAVPHEQCLPIPKGLTPIQAAGIPETFFTVWTNVFQRGKLKAGETILDPRRHQRHRHDRDPAGARVRRAGLDDGGERGEVRGGAKPWRRGGIQLQDRGLGGPRERSHRRPRRRHGPRHGRRRLHAPEHRSARRRWAADSDRVLEEPQSGARFFGRDAQTRVDHRIDVAAAHAGGEGRHRARSARARLAAAREQDGRADHS